MVKNEDKTHFISWSGFRRMMYKLFQIQIGTRLITLEWNPPDHPNGDKLTYKLYRNRELLHVVNDSR